MQRPVIAVVAIVTFQEGLRRQRLAHARGEGLAVSETGRDAQHHLPVDMRAQKRAALVSGHTGVVIGELHDGGARQRLRERGVHIV